MLIQRSLFIKKNFLSSLPLAALTFLIVACGGGGKETAVVVPGGGTTGMYIDNTISDQAQSMTIVFAGLAFVTDSFCAQTSYPPGKVADFFWFQYLRDNDPSGMGHNTDFTTYTLPMKARAHLTTISGNQQADPEIDT